MVSTSVVRLVSMKGCLLLGAYFAATTALAVGPVKIHPSVTPGRFQLAWDAAVGRSYVVEASDDLADWSEVTRISALLRKNTFNELDKHTRFIAEML